MKQVKGFIGTYATLASIKTCYSGDPMSCSGLSH